jgi:hypothetical protein
MWDILRDKPFWLAPQPVLEDRSRAGRDHRGEDTPFLRCSAALATHPVSTAVALPPWER